MSVFHNKAFRNEFGLPQLSNFMENLFDAELLEQIKGNVPAVNIKENQQDFTIDMAAPGLKKEDFKVELNNRILSISSDKQEKKEETDGKYTRREFAFKAFKRNFTLPESVDAEQISANYLDGILSLVLPKRKKDDSSKIINIS